MAGHEVKVDTMLGDYVHKLVDVIEHGVTAGLKADTRPCEVMTV